MIDLIVLCLKSLVCSTVVFVSWPQNEIPTNFDEMMDLLESKSKESRTTRFWLQCLIKPVFKVMLYIMLA